MNHGHMKNLFLTDKFVSTQSKQRLNTEKTEHFHPVLNHQPRFPQCQCVASKTHDTLDHSHAAG